VTGWNTSPLLSAMIVSSEGSVASSRSPVAPPRSSKRSSPAASARAGHRASQVVLYLTPATSCHSCLWQPGSTAVAAASARMA
jgi:hypothetical protein